MYRGLIAGVSPSHAGVIVGVIAVVAALDKGRRGIVVGHVLVVGLHAPHCNRPPTLFSRSCRQSLCPSCGGRAFCSLEQPVLCTGTWNNTC
jgi:hypothetical protein